MKDMYPRLNSNVDGSPATCTLKRAEAVWLTEQMDKGNIRTATPEDIKAWEDLAKKKGRRIQKIELNCGRTYVILKPMIIPQNLSSDTDVRMSGNIVFLVASGVAFPKIERSSSPFYDLETGGWYMFGRYDDGVKEGDMARYFPRYDPSIYSHNK